MQEILQIIVNSFEFQACIRLILGAILPGIIGYEREAWKKPAGMRTHILVGESAVLVMLLGIYLTEHTGTTDVTRIPAQLLSGIGFVGAGTILRDGFHVKGLTTAASLLAVTAIGLTVGAGAYIVAILGTLVVYIILSHTYIVSDNVDKTNEFKMKILTDGSSIDMKAIEKVFARREVELSSLKIEENKIVVQGTILENVNKNHLMTRLTKIDGVVEVKGE